MTSSVDWSFSAICWSHNEELTEEIDEAGIRAIAFD